MLVALIMSSCLNTANNDVDVVFEDEETRAAFESWKSRTYSLTVPLRIVALRSSVPPLWIKVYILSCFEPFIRTS